MAKTFYTSGTGSQQTLTGSQNEKVAVYQTLADAEADLANLEAGQIVATPDTGDENAQPVDVVESGNMHAVTSNAVAGKISCDYADFTEGEVVYTIEVPYLANSNNTNMGSILINARYGFRYILDYYNFINEPIVATTNARIARLRMLDGGIDGGNYLEPTLKWNVDTTNKKVTFYIKKSTLNTTLSFKVLQEMKGINTVKFGKTTDLTVYNNASYSRAFEYLSPVNSVTSGEQRPVTSNAVSQAMSDQFVNIASDAVSLTIPANTGTSGSFTFIVPSGYKVIGFNGYITSGPAGAINLYSFGFPYGRTGTFSTNIFFRNYTSVQQTASINVYLLCARV